MMVLKNPTFDFDNHEKAHHHHAYTAYRVSGDNSYLL